MGRDQGNQGRGSNLSDADRSQGGQTSSTEQDRDSQGQCPHYGRDRVFTQEKLHSMPTGGSTYVLSHPGYRGGDWYINNDVTQYTEGTLVLDFLDRQKHLIVFRGIAQGAVTTSERNAIAIREAVQRIVADLPK